MGIVKKQGISFSIVSYIGIIVGMFNILYVYPKFLEANELGLIKFVIDTSMFLSPFLLLGVHSVALKYFPLFKTEDATHNGFLPFLILYFLVGSVFFFCIFYIFRTPIIDYYSEKSKLFESFLLYILPTAFFYSLFSLLTNYVANFKKIVVPNIIAQSIKFTLPLLVILYFLEIIPIDFMIKGIVIHHVIMVLGLVAYLKFLKKLKLKLNTKFISRKRLAEIVTFSSYSILGSIGAVIANRIDVLMVASLINLKSTGIYAIALTIANVINIPNTAIANIASPLISQAWKDNDLKQIESIYQKASLNLLAFGFLLFLLIYFSIDDLFRIMPNGEVYKTGKSVIIILAVAKLVDMATSVNNHIIIFSKFYKFSTFSILFLSILNIFFNYWLIPKYFILGAAYATLTSIILFNLVKLIFIKVKFNLQPFSMATIKILLLLGVTMALFSFFPPITNPFIAIVIKSLLIASFYGGLLYSFRITPEINDLIQKAIKLVLSYVSKGKQ